MPRLVRNACLTLLVGACVTATTPGFAADNAVVRQFSSGQGIGAVGMVDASEDTEIAGPQAIYSGQDGDLFLLDQVNGRILRFDPKAADQGIRSYELPAELQPTDLVVTRGHIMVWDGDIHALRAQGPDDAQTRGLEEISTRDIDDEFTLSAFAQMGSQKPDSADPLDPNTRAAPSRTPTRVRQAVASRGQGSVIIDVVADARAKIATMEIRRKDETNLFAKLKIEVRDRLGATEFLEIDNQGRMYVLVENVPPTGKKMAAAFVAAFSPQGRLERIFDIPLTESVALSRRFVAVSPEGDIYFLRTRKDSVDVLGVGSRTVRANAIIEGPALASSAGGFPAEARRGKGFTAAVRPLTRQQVIRTAFAFESVQWQVTPAAYGEDPDTACTGFRRVRRPGYLNGKLGQQVRGVPYCWGCHGSLARIGTRIAQGALAGNVCTKNDPRTDVVGVDCSAFVSATWGLAQHFTTRAIPSITDALDDVWSMLPGDAFNKPGSHVMLFLRFTPDRKAEVIESSPGACNGRVCRNVYPVASLLARGYTPVRFRSLASDTTAQSEIGSGKQVGLAEEAPAKPKQRQRQRRR